MIEPSFTLFVLLTLLLGCVLGMVRIVKSIKSDLTAPPTSTNQPTRPMPPHFHVERHHHDR